MTTKRKTIPSFKQQMAQSMAELESIMQGGQSPSGDGRFTVRVIEVREPSPYDAGAVRRLRSRLNVSQAVFAQMMGVSQVLVRSWERGARAPSALARRLMDQVREQPERFSSGLLHRSHEATARRTPSGRKRRSAA